MPTPTTSTPPVQPGDVRQVDRCELRDTIRITTDRELVDELVDELDRARGSVVRSACLEMLLSAALTREHPPVGDEPPCGSHR
jgi:hypothetical protein